MEVSQSHVGTRGAGEQRRAHTSIQTAVLPDGPLLQTAAGPTMDMLALPALLHVCMRFSHVLAIQLAPDTILSSAQHSLDAVHWPEAQHVPPHGAVDMGQHRPP